MQDQIPTAGFSKHYFEIKGKTAEEVVQDLARKTFLTDWCYLNPKLPNGKELCDLLVVFDQIAIVWMVKDLKLDEKGRYKRKEVEKNIRQLSGARRQLFSLKTELTLENPRRGAEGFDPSRIEELYLISVLLGEGEDVFPFVETVKDYVIHVFTRDFVQIVLMELDTVSDFTGYIREKEALIAKDKEMILVGGEEELLAFYLMNGRSFKRFDEADFIVIEEGSWEHLQDRPEYRAREREDEISYYWDSIIDRAHEAGGQYEIIARELARCNRFHRRVLSKQFFDAQLCAHRDDEDDLYRRMVVLEGTTYCFLFADDPEPHSRRRKMLEAICWIARGLHPQNMKVLGIGTEKKIRPTCSYDFALFYIPEWTEENQRQMEELQKKTGIFLKPKMHRSREGEYPVIDDHEDS